ncbi:MAG: hypothetical protein ACKVX7_15960 [Planctomycetota bacterium]
MKTLTVLNPGTGFMRDHTDVVGNLSRMVTGREGEDWMVTAGVAAHGTQHFPRLRQAISGSIDVTRAQPGMLDPITGGAKKAELSEREKLFPALQKGYELGVATKFGPGSFGLEHNVIRVVWWIQELMRLAVIDRGPAPQRVNLVGWSRGAFTCFRIAEELNFYGLTTLGLAPQDAALARRMRELQVNIFAMDPVPGALYKNQMHYYEHTVLPPNVRHLWAVYAEHEARGGMKPLIHKTFSVKTNRVLLRMPGPHDQSVEGASGSAYSKGLESVFKIIQSMCHSFLMRHGTPLANPKFLAEKETLEEYGRIQQRIGEYRAFADVGKTTSGGGRALAWMHSAETPGKGVRSTAAGNLPPQRLAAPGSEHVKGAELPSGKQLEFVNDHHYQLFSRLVPDFGHAGGIKPSEARKLESFAAKKLGAKSLHDVIRNVGAVSDIRRHGEQVKKLKDEFPETYKGFVALGIIVA